MNSEPPATPSTREDLEQMRKSVLVELVLQQQKSLEELFKKVERLQGQLDKDSQTESLPPSSDLIKREREKVSDRFQLVGLFKTQTWWTTRTQRKNPKRICSNRPLRGGRTGYL